MLERIRDGALATAVALVLAFGGSEALAGTGGPRDCGEWNWCAPSQGGEDNCDFCCGEFGGTCINSDEAPWQGCLCN
jgi:hypothetical protein